MMPSTGNTRTCSFTSPDTTHNSKVSPPTRTCLTNAPTLRMESTISTVQNNEDDGVLEHEPTFTLQDEQKDLITLSIKDMVNINSDLYGITAGMSNLAVGSDGEKFPDAGVAVSATKTSCSRSAQSEMELSRLEEELSLLPSCLTAAYYRARRECPGEVRDERMMNFVEYESGDVLLAAKRLSKYWEVRLDLFGEDKCFLPMTFAGAMKDEATPMARQRIWQRLPVTDTVGRVLLFMDPSKRNLAEYSVNQEHRAFVYMMETVIEDEELRRKGVVILMDGRNIQTKHYSRKFKHFAAVMDLMFPTRLRAGHCFSSSRIMYYVLYPVMKRFMSKDMRLRLLLHHGATSVVLRELEGYCLPKDRLPADIGGSIVLDINKWMDERIALENERQNVCDASSPPTCGLATKKPRKWDDGAISNLPDLSAATTEVPRTCHTKGKGDKGRKRNSKKGRDGRGKVSDPRMTKAIELKMANPKLSLYKALIAGGFDFPEDKVELVDADGTTLAQRKNNLCRRVRLEKKKIEQSKHEDEYRPMVSSPETSELDGGESPMSTSPPIIPDSGAAAAADRIDPGSSLCSAKRANKRRDSFYESILELPGIEDVNDVTYVDDDL